MRSDIEIVEYHQSLTHCGRDEMDAISLATYSTEKVWISITISQSFVPKDLIGKILELVQIIAWRRAGFTHLSCPMMVSLLRHSTSMG